MTRLRTFRPYLIGLSFLSMSGCSFAAEMPPVAPAPTFPGAVSDYHGYIQHDFTVDGCAAKVVEPKNAAAGKPWVWRAEFWDAFPATDLVLLEKGYHLAYIEVGNTYGAPSALKHWDPFYAALTGTYGLSKKPVLEGLSRGGLYVYRWAAQNPDKVGVLYGDAPVCDFKSWPAAKGKGLGSAADWAKLQTDYGFANEAEALAFKGNPIDNLAPLAKAKIPIIHVSGDADLHVPMDENTSIVRERYLKLGGEFALVVKRGGAHHPHGLDDPTPVVDFIVARTGSGEARKLALQSAPKSGDVLILNPTAKAE